MKNLMIDTETLGRTPNAIILSIAAVKFEFSTDRIEKFSVNIDPADCRNYGLVSDKETIDWWKNQSNDALAAFTTDQITLDEALYKLSAFIGTEYRDMVVWANGCAFDIPILEWAYRAVQRKTPWKFWNIRDTRTIFKVCDIDMRTYERVGVYHNAVDDCLTQIKALKQALA